MEKTIELVQQNRSARFQPESLDSEKRTVELTWSTGAAVRRMDWWTGTRYNEELSLEKGHVRLGRIDGGGANLIDSHDSFSLRNILGVVEKAWIEDGVGRARVRFSERAEVEPIWRDVHTGIIRNVSVGYLVHRYEKTKFEDEKIETWRATDWEPVEISLVAVPADAGAGVRANQRTSSCTIVGATLTSRLGNPGDTIIESAEAAPAPAAEASAVRQDPSGAEAAYVPPIELLRKKLELTLA